MKVFKNNREGFRFYCAKLAEYLKAQQYTKVQEFRKSNAWFLENYIRELEKRVQNMNRTIARERGRMRRLKRSRSIIETQYTTPEGKKHTESYIVLCKSNKIEKL